MTFTPKPFQRPAPHITRADRPASQLVAGIKATVARQRFQSVTAALDPFARMACEHPEACSCDEDYPDWTAQSAARSTAGNTPQETK